MKKSIIFLILISNIWAKEYKLSLDEAVELGIQNNNQLKISSIETKIAEAIYEQSLSANHPSLDFSISATKRDEDLTFDFDTSVALPKDVSETLALSGAHIKDQLNGTTSNLSQTAAAINAGQFEATTLNLKSKLTLAGKESITNALNLKYPIYSGGKISALQEQAKLGILVSKEDKRKIYNQVVYDIKKYYYTALLLKKIKKVTFIAKESLDFTAKLTKSLYENGSGNVKKTDYLKAQLVVQKVKEVYEEVLLKEKLLLNSLASSMGLKYNDKIILRKTDFEKPKLSKDMQKLIEKAYSFNPDISKIKLALRVQDAKKDEYASEYLPNIVFLANAQNMRNDYESGFVNDDNENSWTIGIALQWNIYNGMKTKNQVLEAQLEKKKYLEQDFLLKDGLALKLKTIFLSMHSTYKKYKILNDTLAIAIENEDLHQRGYEEDLVETEDVLEAQIHKSLSEISYLQQLHDNSQYNLAIDYIIGSALNENLEY